MTDLLCDSVPTPIGDVRLWATTDRVLCFVDFADNSERSARLLTRRFGNWSEQTTQLAASAGLRDYFDGEIDALDGLRVSTGGTPLQSELWALLRSIPAGETLSYGQLAARLGRPTAARAAGAASGLNPVSIVLPCHRVVGAGGALTGYAGGVERKCWLLEHERKNRRVGASPATARAGFAQAPTV